MIEILMATGCWAEVYRDDNLTTEELNEIAAASGLIPGEDITASLPNGTLVSSAAVVAIRFNN